MARGWKPLGQSEAEFQSAVVQYARLHGWKVAHFRKVRVQRRNGSVYHETPVAADGKGFPDLILVRPGRQVAAELKVPGNTTSTEQDEWLSLFSTVPGCRSCVWYPADWPEIEAVLGTAR